MTRSPLVEPAAQAASILDLLPTAIVHCDDQLRVTYANAAARAIIDEPAADEPIRSWFGQQGPLVEDGCRTALDSRNPHRWVVPAGDGGATAFAARPIEGGLVVEAAPATDGQRLRLRLDGFRRLSRAIMRIERVDAVLQVVAREAPAIVGSSGVAFFLLDDQNELMVGDGSGLDQRALNAIALNPAAVNWLTQWIQSTTGPLTIPDVLGVPHLDAGLLAAAQVRSVVIVPLQSLEAVRGAMFLGYADQRHEFDPNEIALAEAIADETVAGIEHAELVSRLAREAMTDPLTGLANLRAFEDNLARHHAQSRRGGRCFSVLLADLDNMKTVNDRFGHAAGDAALRAIGQALVTATRTADMVARVGGDEFAVLLAEADEAGAQEVVSRIVRTVEGLNATFQGRVLPIGISAGAATYPADGESTDVLLQHADGKLYEMKAVHHADREIRHEGRH